MTYLSRHLVLFLVLNITGCYTHNYPPVSREESLRRIAIFYEIPEIIVTDYLGDTYPFKNWTVYEHVSYREAKFLFKRDYPNAVITYEDLVDYK